jgi:hypothetical protein
MSPPKTESDPATLTGSSIPGIGLSAQSPVTEMYFVPGVVVLERFFTVPLDYFAFSRGNIKIFARQCVSMSRQKQMDSLPFIVYLQGGTFVRSRGWLLMR